MPYVDTTPKGSKYVLEEDNLQDVFGKMLLDNGWTLARTFYKAVVDTRAYYRVTDRVNYAIARHTIYRNADGKLLGIATVGQFSIPFRRSHIDPIRRPNDNLDPNDVNYGMHPTWESWVLSRYAKSVTKTNLYFYMLEKLPNEELAPNRGIVSIVTMPGMSETAFEYDRDRDRNKWHSWYYYGEHYDNYDDDPDDMQYDGKILSASPFHVIRSALDIEVLKTYWDNYLLEAFIEEADPIVMQSPIVKCTLRAEFLEYINDPVWHTNWWTDSEVRVQGFIDSRSFFLILQADNAPAWEKNLVPTIPLYFGKINSIDGDKDEGYALFGGTIPPYKKVNTSRSQTTYLRYDLSPPGANKTVDVLVADSSRLPSPPAYLTIGGSEIVKMIAKEGNIITIEREQLGSVAKSPYWSRGTTVARLSTNNIDVDNSIVVSMFDFDDPGAAIEEIIQPLLKLYPDHPSNGVDSVMLSRSRFGARYQAHYLSWGAVPNQIPPTRLGKNGGKYPRAYEPYENTNNYKYQFNSSRYSNKIHASRIFVVHPEEGVRGYLDLSIGFDPQSISSSSNLRVRKQDCPEKVYEMYKYLSVGAVSPLTKVPATPFRPVGVGIYKEDLNPNEEPIDIENDSTPPGEVTITSVLSPQSQTIDIEFETPTDRDFSHVNIYVDGNLYAKGVNRTNFYRIEGLSTGFTPEIKITTVDLAGNESSGVLAPKVTVA